MDAIRLYLQDQPLLPTRTARFAADEFLFHAGEPADEFFLLQDGLVALEMNRVTIATIGADELLGVSWLLTPRAWTWDARALQPVNALAIDRLLARATSRSRAGRPSTTRQVNPDMHGQVSEHNFGVCQAERRLLRLLRN